MDIVYLWTWLIFTSHYINQWISFFAIQSVAFFLTWYRYLEQTTKVSVFLDASKTNKLVSAMNNGMHTFVTSSESLMRGCLLISTNLNTQPSAACA